MRISDLPADIRAAWQRERRNERIAASAFANACAAGDVAAFFEAVDLLGDVGGWRLACVRVARLRFITKEIQQAFLSVWIEHKMLPLTVGNRAVLARALRLLFPSGYEGDPLTVFRGASGAERRRRLYGFSWTQDGAVAHKFAEHWQQSNEGGIVLKTMVPSSAVLLIREAENYYDEGEIVVDPFRLGAVSVIETLQG